MQPAVGLSREGHAIIAQRFSGLRKETTLSVKAIAARLQLGTSGSASVCLLAALDKAPGGGLP